MLIVYAECRVFDIVMLNVVMLSVVASQQWHQRRSIMLLCADTGWR